jgi:hypothetical protein
MYTNLKFTVLLFVFFIGVFKTVAQSGCTDRTAINFDLKVKKNDGSCLYDSSHISPFFKTVLANEISESSGIIYSDGKLWTHNDAGNSSAIFAVDTASGKIVQTVYIDNHQNIDWEDITSDGKYIYVCDCGNNKGSRTDLSVLKIKKSDIKNDSIVHLNAESISFSYSEQKDFVESKTHNFDCEALAAIDDTLYLFTKDRGDFQTRIYKLPKTPGEYSISSYSSFNVKGLITGAAFDQNKKELVLVGYQKGHANSFIWTFTDFKKDLFFSGNKKRIENGNGNEWQTEGICVDIKGNFFISCEKSKNTDASLYKFQIR